MIKPLISKNTWVRFIIISILSFLVWFKFTYPQLAFINISIPRHEALTIAETYLKQKYPEYKNYTVAAVFSNDNRTDRYLQKTLGFKQMKSFLEEHDFDMFFWLVRFYKENEKEEFRLVISAKTGQIIGFKHTISETAARKEIDHEEARQNIINFLKTKFAFNPNQYTEKSDLTAILDSREDHSFSWQKNFVNIPWSEQKGTGTGKLAIGAKIAGNEMLSFSKYSFLIPDEFNRDMARRANIGKNLSTIVRIFYYILLCATVFFVYIRRNHLAMHITKNFYLKLTFILIFLSIAGIFNNFQTILFNLPTTTNFKEYMIRHCMNALVSIAFASAAILIPSLSGELLYNEVKTKQEKRGGFLYYIQTTFLSRSVAQSILLGYLVCIIMLGIQSAITRFGQEYLGVWTTYSWINRIPASTIPALTAFTIGYRASFTEEVMFRLFALNWGRKLFKNTLAAVIISSLIWGFAHSSYPVFPMWFRGLEVTCLGLFLSWVYLRYGIISVITAHFLFDVFWSSAGFLLGTTQTANMLSSLCVLVIPLIFAIIAYVVNKPEVEKPLRWQLNKDQSFNLEVLSTYLKHNREYFQQNSDETIKKKILAHGWDIAVVDSAIEDFRKEKG